MSAACCASLSRTRPVFQSKFQSLIIRRGHKRAIAALAHKLLRTIFFILKRRKHYRDSAIDYEALSVQRNAPRWIKALTASALFRQLPDSPLPQPMTARGQVSARLEMGSFTLNKLSVGKEG